MHIKPWDIAVIRVRLPTLIGAHFPLSWEILGTLQDVNWDRAEPIVLGTESATSYLVSAINLELTPEICLEYKNAIDAHLAQQEYNKFFQLCPAVCDSAKIERLKQTMATLEPLINHTIQAYFPKWLATQSDTRPPWFGAVTAISLTSSDTDDGEDLYI